MRNSLAELTEEEADNRWREPGPLGDELKRALREDVWRKEPIPKRESRLERCGRATRAEIDRASKNESSTEAAEELQRILQHIDELSALAHTRLRRVLKGLPSPASSDAPDWLAEQAEGLRQSCSAAAVTSAVQLVRVVLAEQPNLRVELEPATLGRVRANWDASSKLSWLVAASELPWPGANVRAYWSDEPDQPIQAQSFFLASSVIAHAAKSLEHG